MIHHIRARVTPEIWRTPSLLEQTLSREAGINVKTLTALRLTHTSIDARQRQVMIGLEADLYVNETPPPLCFTPVVYKELPASAPTAVVVGAGPAGLFAALQLIYHGIRPIVLERGKEVSERRRDVALITREQRVNPESNFCFGEGGAGAFSDGKLFTRSKKRGSVRGVLEGLCQFGAETGILEAAHPHIGTDRLPTIIANIRHEIRTCGGEVHFGEAVTSLLFDAKKTRVEGVVTSDSHEYHGPVILATGHSARDIYRLLHRLDVPLQPKGLAIGCRLEHPQALIDQIQYHNPKGRGKWLPAAEYAMVTPVADRGVYSFCMCPGGVVVPSATCGNQVVVNGMSASARASRWANAAMVVEVHPEDIATLHHELLTIQARYAPTAVWNDDPAWLTSPLAMMEVQERLENLCHIMGGRSQHAPAERMTDFVFGRKPAATLPDSSYTPGLTVSALHAWMPPFLAQRLREGLRIFGQRARGFLSDEATLLAIETRTSSPVRIPRDPESLHHPTLLGLYPAGEGAGQAGGIVSAAIDGMRCADALAATLV